MHVIRCIQVSSVSCSMKYMHTVDSSKNWVSNCSLYCRDGSEESQVANGSPCNLYLTLDVLCGLKLVLGVYKESHAHACFVLKNMSYNGMYILAP